MISLSQRFRFSLSFFFFYHQWLSRHSSILFWVSHPVFKESHETETTCSSEAGEDRKVSMNEIKSFRMINKLLYVLNVIINFFMYINLFIFYEKVLRHLGWKWINLENILILYNLPHKKQGNTWRSIFVYVVLVFHTIGYIILKLKRFLKIIFRRK